MKNLLFIFLCLLSASLARASDVCFEVTWKANEGLGPSAKQKDGPQYFITINGRTTVGFLTTPLRKIEYDATEKVIWSVSRGCARPQDFFFDRNQIEFRFVLGEGEPQIMEQGWLSVWVTIFFPNKTTAMLGTATYYAHPTTRSWSMIRSFEADLAAIAPELAAEAMQRQRELGSMAQRSPTEENSYGQFDLDYEAALNGVKDKNFFEISLDALARFQEASARYQFHRQGLVAKRSELERKTEDLRQATAAAKAQLEAAARAQGFDLEGRELLDLDLIMQPLEAFASPQGTEQPEAYPYQPWAEQAVSAMQADLELGARDQVLLKALQWQERVEALISLIQGRADLSKAELNAFEGSANYVNEYLFGHPGENRPGILSRDYWFTDLNLDPTVTAAIDGELAKYRPEAARRLKAAINELATIEGLVMHIKAAATIASLYKAAQNEQELAFLDKLTLGVTAMIEAAPSVGACMAKNWAAGAYADFHELYYELDFCSGKPNDEVDRSLAAGSLLIEGGSVIFLGPLGPWAADKLTASAKFLKRMLDAVKTANATRASQRLEKVLASGVLAYEQKLLHSTDDFRALAKGMPEIEPELVEKILRGAPKPRNKKEIIGVHSPSVFDDPGYRVANDRINADGTISCDVEKVLTNGSWSVQKPTVLFPKTWSDEKIINAARIASGSKALAVRTSGRVQATLHRVLVDGVEIIALREPPVSRYLSLNSDLT